MLEHTFQCPLSRGLHARPASHLQTLAKRYQSRISLENLRNGKSANVRSIFSLVGAEIRNEDRCRLSVCGPDQNEAHRELCEFIEKELAGCDHPVAESVRSAGQVILPQSLLAAQPDFLTARGAVVGLAQACLHVLHRPSLPERLNIERGDSPYEVQRFERACRSLSQQLQARIQLAEQRDEREILQAHLGLVTDEDFGEQVQERLRHRTLAAGEALLQVVRHYRDQFQAAEDEVFREKVLDLDDLCRCLLVHMYGFKALESHAIALTEPSILAVPSLTPGEFLELDREMLRGLVLADAGTTSHTVILARARGIPTLTGVDFAAVCPFAGQPVILDGSLELLILNPDAGVQAYYDLEKDKQEKLYHRASEQALQPAVSRDGTRLEVSANITCAEEAAEAFASGASGIGLFRTEMLFMDRDDPPGEEDQVEAYRTALEAAGSKRVILRTFDVGADKCPPYMDLECLGNVDLDKRGVRLYRHSEELFRIQLRAILRAAPAGNAWIMIPMVSNVEEVLWVQAVKAELEAELRTSGVAGDGPVPLGAMIETPEAALAIDSLCDNLDFFSIGTNDLTHYLLSVDRTHGFSPAVRSDHNPELIRLLQRLIQRIRARGKRVGLCGEMAADPAHIPLWLGLGLQGISVSSTAIAKIKQCLATISAAEARKQIPDLMACPTTEAVTEKIQAMGQDPLRDLPLVDSQMVLLDVELSSKALILKALADHLYVNQRARDAVMVENALWEREKTYSTGLGHGLAIPHCACDGVVASTIAVMRLAQPVFWDALDGQPVSIVILLAHSQTGQEKHLGVFARLSRLLMREAFRDVLQNESSSAQLAATIQKVLRLNGDA